MNRQFEPCWVFGCRFWTLHWANTQPDASRFHHISHNAAGRGAGTLSHSLYCPAHTHTHTHTHTNSVYKWMYAWFAYINLPALWRSFHHRNIKLQCINRLSCQQQQSRTFLSLSLTHTHTHTLKHLMPFYDSLHHTSPKMSWPFMCTYSKRTVQCSSFEPTEAAGLHLSQNNRQHCFQLMYKCCRKWTHAVSFERDTKRSDVNLGRIYLKYLHTNCISEILHRLAHNFQHF